jgi:hypothetical protein
MKGKGGRVACKELGRQSNEESITSEELYQPFGQSMQP